MMSGTNLCTIFCSAAAQKFSAVASGVVVVVSNAGVWLWLSVNFTDDVWY